MHFTEYGKSLAAAEEVPVTTETGAVASMKAIGYDSGNAMLLTGHDARGRRIEIRTSSLYGAFFAMRSMWVLGRAWHVREDGTRKLAIRR